MPIYKQTIAYVSSINQFWNVPKFDQNKKILHLKVQMHYGKLGIIL